MIMKKRHAYNLAILLAAGSIMISACGKKTDVPAVKSVTCTDQKAKLRLLPDVLSSHLQINLQAL